MIGTHHTFNYIADTIPGGVFISLKNFNDVKIEGKQATLGGGVTYSTLIKEVEKCGLAITNVPSLPHVNVIGSMITTTHGSGYN